MTNRRFHVASAAPLRRLGPRCHGGASSMLRLGLGAAPQRAAPARIAGWLGRPAGGADGMPIEHVLGRATAAVFA